MKRKDTVYLVLTIVIVTVVAILAYSALAGKKSSSGAGTTVEVITPIPASFDQSAMATLADPNQVTNFTPAISIDNLGNGRPFGPLR
ncbi:MAG TPA: hypothetical protein VLE72_01240 [Candidatus Saccharimonadales bacterium]|nr:hypothetical protein [Candidatus Saccharimonadales bacterium]